MEPTDGHGVDRPSDSMLSDTAPVQLHCYLLDLPKELRLEIYELLLTPRKITVTSYDTPTIRGLSDEEIAKTMFFVMPPGDLAPQVLRVCHQIYEEAGGLLYNPSYLHLRPAESNRRIDGEAKDNAIDMTRMRTDRRLKKLRVDLIVSQVTVNEDIRYSQVLRRLYKNLSARRMLVVVEDADESSRDDEDGLHPILDGLGVLLTTWSKSAACGDLSVRYVQADLPGGSWRKLSGDEWKGRLSKEERDNGIDLSRRADVFRKLKTCLSDVTVTGGRSMCEADLFSDEESEEDTEVEANVEGGGDSEMNNEA